MSDKIDPPIVTDGSGNIGGRLQPPRTWTTMTSGGADSGSSDSVIVESTGGASDTGGGGGGGNGFTERLMLLGGWGLTLGANTPPDIRDKMVEFGHIVITPTRLDPRFYTDSTLLSVARYTGVLLSVNNQGDKQPMDLQGAGLEFHLGDSEGKGFIYETARVFNGHSFANVLNSAVEPFGLLRDDSGNTTAIEPGTIHSVPGTYSGTHIYQTQRSAIRYVCDLFDAEYRINPNGTLDAGKIDDLYVTEPEAIVVRRGAGGDPNVKSLAVSQLRVETDARDLSTRVVVLAEGEGDTINVGSADLLVNPYKDIHGNPLVRTRLVSEAETEAANASQRASIHLNEHDEVAKRLTLSAEDYDVEGTFNVGDTIWVYDPESGLVDATNSVRFRGHEINPVSIRVVGVSTPIRKGMGVFYRDADGNYTDLTDWVVWQSGPVTIEIGEFPRTLVPHELDAIISGRVNAPATGDDGSVPDIPAHINTPWDTGNYLDDQGITRSWIQVEWDEPLNTDASTVTDGSHYDVRWRLQGQTAYQYASVSWGTETLLIQDLSPAVTYEISVQAVDIFGNQSGYGADTSVIALADVIPPSTPAAATVAGSTLYIQVQHSLGVSGGGTFNLESDLSHLNVYADVSSGFTPSASNLLGRITATAANLSLGIPVIGTFEMPDTTERFVKVTAVDLAGNESAASVAASVTATLIDTQHITDLAVTNAKINDLSASKITAGTIAAQEIILSNSTASILRSSNFVAGSAGWRIRGDGDAEFNNVTVRGTIDATAGSLGDLDVIGTLELGAGGEITIPSTSFANTIVRIGYLTGVPQFGGIEIWGDIAEDDEPSALYSTLAEELTLQVGIANSASFSGVKLRMTSGNGIGFEPGFTFQLHGADSDFLVRHLGDQFSVYTSGTQRLSIGTGSAITSVPWRISNGSANAPSWSFSSDTDTGVYRSGANTLDIATGGVRRVGISQGHGVFFGAGGTATSDEVFRWDGTSMTIAMHDLFPDIGNHEVLRANRGAGTQTTVIGYYSSWEFDPDTGERKKDDIVPLAESPRWDREWFYQLQPIDFRRMSTGEREFGFNLNQWTEVDDNLKYLTTKGDRWGGQPHELAIIAAMTIEVQDHEKRLRAIESSLGIM